MLQEKQDNSSPKNWRNKMKKTLLCLVTIGLIFTGCYTRIKTYDYDIRETATREQVKNAILVACEDRGWIAKEKDNSTISAKLLKKGTYEVYIDIIYTETNYKIEYVDSVNLRARDKKWIHPSYAKWINFLQKSINAELFKIN